MIKKVFPILAASIFSAMLGVGLVNPLLPLYASDMGASGLELSFIFAGYSFVNTIATPIMGRISDRKGRKWFLSIGLAGYTVLSLGYVWADSILLLVVVRLLLGAAGAMIGPIAMAYIGDISPRGEEGKWAGYANAAFFAGFGLGPLLGGTLAERFGMNVSFYSMGCLCLLAFLIAVVLLPESSQRKVGERGNLSFRKMSASDVIRGLFSFRMVQAIGNGSFMTFLPVFVSTHIGLNSDLIGILLAVNMLPTTLLAGPVGRMADRFNRKTHGDYR